MQEHTFTYFSADPKLCRAQGFPIFRSLVDRGNYFAQDRADIRYVVKDLFQRMSKLTNADMI
jgi:hypothetical protein